MAGENISSPVRLDISGSDGGNSRRSLTRSREKTLSRYQRASTGSCHDFCKYGKKHEPEENAKLPFRKRNMKKPSSESNLVRRLDLQQRMKIAVTESKYFPNSQSRTPDTSGAVEFQLSPYSLDRKDSTTHGVLSDKEKTSAAKLKPKHSLNSSSPHDTSNVLKFEVSTTTSDRRTSRKHETPSKEKKTSTVKIRSLPNLKFHLSDAPKVMQKGGWPSSKKLGVPSKEVSLKAKEKGFSKSRNTSSKLKSHAEKLPSASVPSEGLSVKRGNGISDMKMGKRTSSAKVDVKKALSSPRPSSLTARKNQNLKVVPPQKNQNKVEKAETEQPLDEHDVRNKDALEEKTLYVIKMETENILLESDKNENCAAELSPPIASSPKSSTLPMSPPLSSHVGGDENESEYTDDSSNSEYYEDDEYAEDETVNVEEVEILEGENGGRPRNSRTEFSDEKDCRPVKLSFRRGKVVDIQSENNSARKLKFRRGRLLGGNQNVKGERRTFKMKELDGSVDENQPGGEKVVLRHQDLQQGKKDEKGLFNNVIEETASKLVETRKSKVKALVGAFETVISLQDAKPLANT